MDTNWERVLRAWGNNILWVSSTGKVLFCANHPADPLWDNPEREIGRAVEKALPGKAGAYLKDAVVRNVQDSTSGREISAPDPETNTIAGRQITLIPLDDHSIIARFSSPPPASEVPPLLESSKEVERIRQLARAAEEANDAKSMFVANMSHEIRTPLNGITGILEMLMETPLDEEQREFTEIMRSSADALLLIINDILDFSKMEAGKLDLEYIDFDFRSCVESAVEMLSFRAMEKDLDLAVLMQPGVPERVNGDPGRLRQILLNLISNALKFTHDGEILVLCALEEDRNDEYLVHVDVSDTGIGIPEQVVDSLFHPFTQADSSTTRHYGGTGLGLSICKQIVNAMGGSIGVKNLPNGGCQFSFTMRLGKAASPDNLSSPVVIPEKESIRILILDDIKTNRIMFREMLQKRGYQTAEASSGSDALGIMQQSLVDNNPFHIVLVDYQMPDMDGRQFGTRVRKNADFNDVSLVLVPSSPARGDATRMVAIGFDAYFPKPMKREELEGCINAVLRRQNSGSKRPSQALITKHTLAESLREGGNILLVEDSPTNYKVVSKMLDKLGYSCDIVIDGKEAVATFGKRDYDLILMDCGLPGIDGYEATRQIRQMEGEVTRTPIIALTADAMTGVREKCLKAGMDDYLTKPIQKRALKEMIEAHLPNAQAKLRLFDQRDHS